MNNIILIADTVQRAHSLADQFYGTHRVIPTSVRSIRHYGAARGFADVDAILVDENVWPIPDDIADKLLAYCIAPQLLQTPQSSRPRGR